MSAPWAGVRPWLVAELGVNHDGDLHRALQMVGEAAAAGFDAVKLQHWHLDELLAPDAPTARYQGPGTQRNLLAPLALGIDELRAVRDEAAACGVAFLCTADGTRALADVLTLGPTAVKIGSGDADNPWLLEAAAASGLPLLCSTGMATAAEVRWITARLDPVEEVVLLHCVSAYPTPLADAALGRIPWLAQTTGRPVGYSDHTLGAEAAAAAVALGAVVVEKHVTWDPRAPGPDHAASLPLADAPTWVGALRAVATALEGGARTGAGSAAEAENRAVVRKALHTRRALPAGHRLAAEDLVPLRPLGDGLPASARDGVIGRRLRRPMPAHTPLRAADLEDGGPGLPPPGPGGPPVAGDR